MNLTRVAAIQYKPHKLQPQKSREKLAELIEEAAKERAKIIVCPEMAISGYLFSNKESIIPFSEEPLGETFQCFSPIAKKYQAYIICGYIEKESHSENLYNSAMVISPQGDLITSYRKVLLYDADMLWATPGEEYCLIETEYGLLTVGICMDLNDIHFPLFLIQKKPDITAFCTNWLDQGEEVIPYWKIRLYGYLGLFVAANTFGSDRPYDIYHQNRKKIPFVHDSNRFSSFFEDEEVQFSGKSAILNNDDVLACAPKFGNAIIYSDLTRKI
jgi:predicted amidohydrolase